MATAAALRYGSIVLISFAAGAAAGWFSYHWTSLAQPIAEARTAFEQEKFDLALRLAQMQLRLSPGGHPEAERLIARCFAAQKKWAEAVKAFDQTVATSPEDFLLHVKSHFYMGHQDETLAALAKGLKAFPSHPQLAELETRILAASQKTKEALASAERLLAIPGKEVSARLILGMIHYSIQNHDQAADNLRRALALSPTLEGQSDDTLRTPPDVANEVIAASLVHGENAEGALEYARAAFEVKPTAERSYLAARSAVARNAWNDARMWIDRALAIDPKNLESLALRIDVEIHEGRIADAARTLATLEGFNRPEPSLRHLMKLARARIEAAQRSADAKAKRK